MADDEFRAAAIRRDGDVYLDSMSACPPGGSMTHERTIFEGGLISL